MLNESRNFDSPAALADHVEEEAAAIRARASRASAGSQRIMSSEAAAYERVARMLRKLEAQ